MGTKQTVSVNGAGAAVKRRLSEREVGLVRATLMQPRNREPSEEEVELFRRQVERTGLDPFDRQIYVVYRYSRRRRREEMSIETSIDGLRLIAERSGTYEGQTPIYWCGRDGAWRESWPHSEPPVAAKVGVLKRGAREPTWGTAHFVEYAELYEDSGRPKGFYASMPRNQIAKCAEALALRKAFPAELSGLYTAEEMARASVEAQPSAGADPEADEVAGEAARAAQDAAAEAPQVEAEGMQAVSEGPEADRGQRPAEPAARAALREAVARAGYAEETIAEASRLFFETRIVDRLSTAQLRELTDLIDTAAAGRVAEPTLRGQLTKAAASPDPEAAPELIRRWLVRRANRAVAGGEGASEVESQSRAEDGRGGATAPAAGGESAGKGRAAAGSGR